MIFHWLLSGIYDLEHDKLLTLSLNYLPFDLDVVPLVVVQVLLDAIVRVNLTLEAELDGLYLLISHLLNLAE